MTSKDEIFNYLTNLRDSGKMNMFASIPYLMEEFDMSREEASQAFGDWQISLLKPYCEDCE